MSLLVKDCAGVRGATTHPGLVAGRAVGAGGGRVGAGGPGAVLHR